MMVRRMSSPIHQPSLACARLIASVDFGNLATPVRPGGSPRALRRCWKLGHETEYTTEDDIAIFDLWSYEGSMLFGTLANDIAVKVSSLSDIVLLIFWRRRLTI